MARAPSPRKHPRSDDALVVVRCAGGSRLSRPLLAAHHHLPTTTYIFYTSTRPFFTMARAPSPRKHPRSDDALVVVRCAGGSRLSRPLLAAHHHLPTTTYIFYTSTRPFFTMARALPSCDRLRGSLRSGDMSPRGGVATSATLPPCVLKPTNCHLPTTHYINAIANRNYQLPSTNYPLHKCNRKSQIQNSKIAMRWSDTKLTGASLRETHSPAPRQNT